MVQTIVTPKKANLDMSVLLPENYVGKEVHVLFYTDDEMSNTTALAGLKKKPSDYIGSLSLEEGEKLQQYILESRNEWERDI